MVPFLHGRWTVPVISGLFILTSVAIDRLADSSSWADAFMIAAAVVAGTPVVIKAVRALAAKVIGIDLLVSVAAIRDNQQIEIAAGEVVPGETVLVKNGAKVPVDGVVLGGTGAVDEASITGESIPVEKSSGDKVFAGTISTSGFLQVRATGVGADTTLARIIHRVEEAQDAKAKTAKFMDRFSAWYAPAIIVLAIVVGLATRDIVLALTLLVISCPGALVISIPVSIVAGIGRGARDGILIKGGEYLETSAKVDAIALDKTGTLTEGRPQVADVVVLDTALGEDEVLGLAARAEAGSEHPLARPIVEAADGRGLRVDGLPEQIEPVPGKGIVAWIDGERIAVGNMALMEGEVPAADLDNAQRVVDEMARVGRTPMVVARAGWAIGVIAVADRVRADASEMVARLHAAGVKKVVMLTGDMAPVAHAVAERVGIDEVHAGLLPEDKLDVVKKLQGDGHTVAMVGDGVNDAPALATADIGVAMGAAGTGVAIETADIALMKDDLLKLPQAIGLARRTVNNMRQNIVIALGTVAALMLGVLFGGVTMAIGMLVHEVSVLVVILNAMRLLRKRAERTRSDRGHEAHEGVDVADEESASTDGFDDLKFMKTAKLPTQ